MHVYAPDGTRIGQILMPEGCANLCFVGERRNRLFHLRKPVGLHALYGRPRSSHHLSYGVALPPSRPGRLRSAEDRHGLIASVRTSDHLLHGRRKHGVIWLQG